MLGLLYVVRSHYFLTQILHNPVSLCLDFYDFSLVRATDAAFANVFLAPSVFQCRHTTVCVGYERCTDGKESTVSAFSLSLQRFVCMR